MKKKLTYFSAIVLALSLSSCEYASFLDQTPYSQTSPENFYKTETSLKMALTACYEALNTHSIPGLGNVQRGSYEQGMIYIMNCPSDDLVAQTSGSTEGLEMSWANYVESTQCVREMWKVMYTGINRCNTMLHYIDQGEVSDELKIQYKAEARFLRAFYYYHLAWNFGGVPIVLEYDSDGTEPRSSLEEVYKLIFEDLDFAYANLKPVGILSTSSANKYTAAAYIARICNYLAACKRNGVGADLVAEQPLNDFAFVDADAMSRKALDVCKDVIENSSYTLIPDYTKLFRETTKSDQYKECLFLAEQALSGSEGHWPNSFYLPTPTCNGDSPTVWGGRFVPTPRAFYMYDPADPRRDHNMTGRLSDGKIAVKVDDYTYWNPAPPRTRIEVKDASGNPVMGDDGQPLMTDHPLYDSETQTYMPVAGIQVCPGKFRLCGIDEIQRIYNQHAVSYPLMRLADVYLMYAEALYFCGDEPLARKQIESVLRRACGNDEQLFAKLNAAYHRDNFLEELLESRERELVFEFSRKWDLIRFNLIDEKIASLNPDMVEEKVDVIADPELLKYPADSYLKTGITILKQNWQHHKIWLPISEEQRGVNPGLGQNANW